MKCTRDNDGRSVDRQSKQALRKQAVKAVRNGQSVGAVAAAFGVNERTVFRWLERFANGGQKALDNRPVSGRPPKLTGQQLQWIARAVKDDSPQQYKFAYGLWTLALIRQLIQRRFDVTLSVPSVGRLMKLLGYSAQKPLYQAWQQDPVLVRRWERQTYPQIRKAAKKAGATIYFADESGIRSDHHSGTTWAPSGQTPVLETTGQRFSLNMLSAVSPRGECRFMVHEGSVTAKVFQTFLKRLLQGNERPVYLIVDGHPSHRAKLIKEYVASTNGLLTLFFLPPYSPQLNPDEQVWAHVKREISRRGISDKRQLKFLAVSALRRLQKLPGKIRTFFQQPECQYAA